MTKFLTDGKLIYQDQIQSENKDLIQEKVYDMHSLAAKIKAVKADRLNGFEWWQVVRNGEKIGIDKIRENYRLFLKDFKDLKEKNEK